MPNVSDGPSPVQVSPASSLKRRASFSSSHTSDHSHHSPPLSPEIGYNAAYQYSTNPPAPGGTASLRRREANRLAAQRFRSRKKGYQDSLEERIRVLESEKEVLIRQVDESLSRTGHPSTSLQPRSSNLRHAQVDGDGVDGAHWPGKRNSNSTHRSTSPERRETLLDADVRIASLESANRRLQDDVRNLIEENEQLRDEVRRWRTWHGENDHSRRLDMADGHHPRRSHRLDMVDGDSHDRSHRHDMVDGDHSPRMDRVDGHTPRQDRVDGHTPRLDRVDGHTPHSHHAKMVDGDHPRPNLPPLDRSMAYPSSSSSSSFGSTPQDSRSESFSRSTHQDGSNIQLPPLRLPPIRSALPGNASTTLPSPSLPISLRSFDGPTRDRQPHMDGHR